MNESDKRTNPSLRFTKEMRLLKGGDYDPVFAAKCSAGDKVLVLYGKPNGLDHPRLGMAVSRKVGKANHRNRWKRLLREAFRLAQHDLPALDLICLPRLRGEPSFEIIDASLRRLAKQVAKRAHSKSKRTNPKSNATTETNTKPRPKQESHPKREES